MNVADPRGPQLFRQGRLVELGVVSRSRNTAHVYDALYTVRSQTARETLSKCAWNAQSSGQFSISFYFAETNMDCRRRSSNNGKADYLASRTHQELCVDCKFHSGSGVQPRFKRARLLLSIRLTCFSALSLPRDGEQEGAVFLGFNIMGNALIQDKQLPRR